MGTMYIQEHPQRNIETKKAPWSAPQIGQLRDGLPLGEIQRLEREKKLEQIREQQHMVQLLAQEQAAVAAREQVINVSVHITVTRNEGYLI